MEKYITIEEIIELVKLQSTTNQEEIIIEDDGDDWSAVPAFLRRNKK